MTLLNGLLALGSFAFAVPLVIHLLFKSRFRTVDWGAMHLLDGVVRINRRRVQWMHLLLLLLRCLLPVLLALCLARPVLTGFRALPGDAPQSLILAVDDSRSMSVRDASGQTRIDRIKQELAQQLADLSRRDEVILIRSSQLDAPTSSMGPQEAVKRVREIETNAGPFDLGRLVSVAVEAADEAAHAQRRVIVVSDFQTHLLSDAAMRTLGRLSSNLEGKAIRPVISFLKVGTESDQLSNTFVESVEVDTPAVVAGRGARFSARLRNASDAPAGDLRVVWSIDGQALAPRTLSIPPRASVTTQLSHRIEKVGVHEVSVSLELGDAMIADNRRTIAVDVIREIDVLLVDGQPGSRPLQGETDFLAIALSPFAFGGEDQPDAVRTTVTTLEDLPQQLDDRVPEIIVLANVAMLDAETKRMIARFVTDGGGLIFFDGNLVQPDSYNTAWDSDGTTWLLPAELGAITGTETSRDARPLPLGDRNIQYAPWDVLGPPDQRPFDQVEVFGYRKLNIVEDSERDDPSIGAATRLLVAAGGDPLIVMADRGRGKVVQFAVPCDAAWSTLPMRLVYLPMMQQLVLDLAGSRKATTFDVGEGFSIATDELSALLPNDFQPRSNSPATFTVQVPGQSERPIQPSGEDSGRLVVRSGTSPGTYIFRQMTPTGEPTPIVTRTIRVVEVPPVESHLRDAESSRLSAAAGLVGAEVYADLAELQSDDQTRRFGREIWRWLLAGLLVAMVAELLLQQWTVRAPVVGTS